MMEPSPGPSGSASGRSDSVASCLAPPSRKKTKRDSKWQDDWKKYHMKPSKKEASFAHCCMIFQLPPGVFMRSRGML